MTVLSAQSILLRKPIKDPLPRTEVQVGDQTYTYGVSPAGYDLRLDTVRGPLTASGNWVILPGQFILASALEEFDMPNDLIGVVHDKSSWARRGLAVQNTVIEPGWRGWLTLELTNHSKMPLTLEKGVGICQVIFHQLDEATDQPYSGKYQDQQAGPQAAI